MFVQRRQDSSGCEGELVILLEAWKLNRGAYQGEAETQVPFPLATGILGFLSIFNRSQASSYFQAFLST